MNSTTPRPNTFIIGAPKCGTTALSEYLSTHPNAFLVTPKEPCFWSTDIRESDDFGLHSVESYFSLFARSRPEHTVRIEASTTYLWSKVAVPAILAALPGAKFIIMLRNPVDLAYAYYMEELYWQHEDLPSFEQAWHACPERRAGLRIPALCPDAQNLDYERIASIGMQLKVATQHIPKKDLLVLFLQDLAADPQALYKHVLSFLELPDDGRIDFPRLNAAKALTKPLASRLLLYPPKPLVPFVGIARKCLWSIGIKGLRMGLYNRINTSQQRTPLDSSFKTMLIERFRGEIETVQALTQRDLSDWLINRP